VATIRVFINVISAIVALLALHLGGTTISSFAVALLVVGLFCYLAKLDGSSARMHGEFAR
jgi:uncharacterized membrane protein YgaE (UPF0421/DUF939 family)